MSLLRPLLLLLFGLSAALPAHAYTPEGGVWWNPNEPGTGIMIEIQDNFLFAAAYTYGLAGNAQWYTASGFLVGNARFDGVLDAFDGGNCPGCVYRPNRDLLGTGGPISIIFDPDDNTRASLTWGGRTMPIERFHFYLKRPEDERALPGVEVELTKMLGEWQMVLDYSGNTQVTTQYFGDVVVLDRLGSDQLGDFVDGCRPLDSLSGVCSSQARAASLEFVPASGEQVLLVDNDADTFAAYFLTTGTDRFEGEVSVYFKDSTPRVFYPVRGFRSASRSFVTEGIGPSKQGQAGQAARGLPRSVDGDKSGSAKTLSAEQLLALRAAERRLREIGAPAPR